MLISICHLSNNIKFLGKKNAEIFIIFMTFVQFKMDD